MERFLAATGFLWSLVEIAAGHPSDGMLTALLSIALLVATKEQS